MAKGILDGVIANNFNKIIEGAKVGSNVCKLDSVQVYDTEYNGDWSRVSEFVFNIGGTLYGKKLFLSKKAKSQSELKLDIDMVGRVNNLLLKVFGVQNPNLIAILQSSPVEYSKEVKKYNKDVIVDEYKPQQLINTEVVVVMRKNDSGYFEVSWMFNKDDKEAIAEAEKKAKDSGATAIAKPTSIGANGNRPTIGGANGNRPTIKVGQ